MNKSKILYIEDSDFDAELLGMRLDSSDLDIVRAHSISEAYQIFNPKDFMAVVVDWNLGDGTGLDFAHTLRKTNSDFPIIFLSALYTDENLKLAEDVRPLSCLEKNTSLDYLDEIPKLIHTCLKKAS